MPHILADLEARFLRYVQIDTQSDEATTTVPSTKSQFDLLRILEAELLELGASEVQLTSTGFVLASIPATVPDAALPCIALLAHVDTTAAFSGTHVKPVVHRSYDGGTITFPDDPALLLAPHEYPYLQQKVGDDIVTASGTTLLGADDKAGVAIIMSLAAHLLTNPDVPHGPIRICFTPDEEIGTGILHLDPQALGADVAYTLDGSVLGELVYETFSADKAVVDIVGVSAHPGAAYGKLVNALHLAAALVDELPRHARTPETSRRREGFIHVYHLEGLAAQARVELILRDFEEDALAEHGAVLQRVCAEVAAREPHAKLTCTITPQYRNMRRSLEADMRPVDVAVRAMEAVGITPMRQFIRGGTDGSQLTARGVPTPNLFTGMQNIHGPLEWVSLQDMAKSVEVCLALVQLWAGYSTAE